MSKEGGGPKTVWKEHESRCEWKFRILFWKEVSKVNGGKVEYFNRIKNGNGRLVLEEAEVQRDLEGSL